MSKYRGLPDIDTAPDVFETADEPEPPLRPNEDGLGDEDAPIKAASEGIDGSGLPARRKAERVFGRGSRRPGDTGEAKFRPRLPPLRRRSGSTASEESITPPPRETPAARLRRLKAELVEVEREITAGSAGPSTLPPAPAGEGSVDDEARDRGKEGKRKSVLPLKEKVDLISELTALRERMGEIDLDAAGSGTGAGSAEEEWEARLQRLAGGSGPGSGLPASGAGNGIVRGNGGDHDVSTGTRASAGAGSTGLPSEGGLKLSELDRRLASLEDLVGPSGEGINPTTTSTPLLTTLSRLDHLVALLTQPRHLDAISRRVKLLLVDLDRAAAASRRPLAAPSSVPDKQSSSVTLSGAEYANLQTLFAVLPRLDPLLPILPPLLARLRSLAVLHAEASEIADGLRTLQSEDKRTGEEVKEMEEVVRNVQAGLAESVLAVQKNWEGVEGRMRSLDERVSKLVARV
ncbi:hypothetical protein EHS25_001061 [Saitozyma podzolica]|uniref:Dynactin subunit 2 n=1 Tax=Saitozyma podzolica TaxID=1890683 RepID=A0A427YH50_9TREE|nr:hypothetical protein EHS25_001061 [Saitozyma podzolica]